MTEERDSLAAVVKRFDATPKTLRNGQVYKDLRTLINEVKGWEQQFADLETVDTGIIRRLEAEVKELREENAESGRQVRSVLGEGANTGPPDRTVFLESRIKQMEEALREIALRETYPTAAIARAALSPSDTG